MMHETAITIAAARVAMDARVQMRRANILLARSGAEVRPTEPKPPRRTRTEAASADRACLNCRWFVRAPNHRGLCRRCYCTPEVLAKFPRPVKVRPERIREPRPERPKVELDPARACRHCSARPVNRPRGLCWSCFHDVDTRALYPSTSKFARRYPDDDHAERPSPDRPTSAPPGSAEKLAVMDERAAAKVSLWHPADARFWGDPVTQEWFASEHGAGLVSIADRDVQPAEEPDHAPALLA